MLIRHIKTGEIREIELVEFKNSLGLTTAAYQNWEEIPDDPTAGVPAVVSGDDGPPPLEAEVSPL